MYNKTYRCDCLGGEHYLDFIFDEDYEQFYIEFVSDLPKLSLWYRIKTAYQILFSRNPVCLDDIVMERTEKLEDLITFLNDGYHIRKNKCRK